MNSFKSNIDLIKLNKIMHKVPYRERDELVATLEKCLEPENEENRPVFYRIQITRYAIYKAIKKFPFCLPKYTCLMTEEDARNSKLEEEIGRGVAAYLNVPQEKREALKKSWLNKWSFRNMTSRAFQFFSKSNSYG